MKYLFSSLIIILGFVSTYTVSAHVLEIDKTVGAIFHMDPEDDPIAGQPTTFYFEMKDTAKPFDPLQYATVFAIFKEDKVITSGNVYASNISADGHTYMFEATVPEKGLYNVVLNGSSTNPQSESFQLSFDVRVEREAGVPQAAGFWAQHFVHILLFAAALIIVLVAIFRDSGSKNEYTKTNN